MNWSAKWIWHPPTDSPDNFYVYARREIDLNQQFDEANLFITASSLYKLYINGEYVQRGPNPSDPSRYYYDVPLPWRQDLREKKTYTLLVRVINSDGMPVSEEQEIRLQLPEDWEEMVPGVCAPGPESLVANAGDWAVQDQAASFVGMAPFSSLR